MPDPTPPKTYTITATLLAELREFVASFHPTHRARPSGMTADAVLGVVDRTTAAQDQLRASLAGDAYRFFKANFSLPCC